MRGCHGMADDLVSFFPLDHRPMFSRIPRHDPALVAGRVGACECLAGKDMSTAKNDENVKKIYYHDIV
jgi:hypothetical protein